MVVSTAVILMCMGRHKALSTTSLFSVSIQNHIILLSGIHCILLYVLYSNFNFLYLHKLVLEMKHLQFLLSFSQSLYLPCQASLTFYCILWRNINVLYSMPQYQCAKISLLSTILNKLLTLVFIENLTKASTYVLNVHVTDILAFSWS